jgi:hypothetical protein
MDTCHRSILSLERYLKIVYLHDQWVLRRENKKTSKDRSNCMHIKDTNRQKHSGEMYIPVLNSTSSSTTLDYEMTGPSSHFVQQFDRVESK